jgi:hypothetical protein
LKNFTVPVWDIGGKLLHPISFLVLPAAWVGCKSGGCFGGHAFAHNKTPRQKTGLSEIYDIGDRVVQTFHSPGGKCPNGEFIARNCVCYNTLTRRLRHQQQALRW